MVQRDIAGLSTTLILSASAIMAAVGGLFGGSFIPANGFPLRWQETICRALIVVSILLIGLFLGLLVQRWKIVRFPFPFDVKRGFYIDPQNPNLNIWGL